MAPLNGKLRPLQLRLFALGRVGVLLRAADGDAPTLEPADDRLDLGWASYYLYLGPDLNSVFQISVFLDVTVTITQPPVLSSAF